MSLLKTKLTREALPSERAHPSHTQTPVNWGETGVFRVNTCHHAKDH